MTGSLWWEESRHGPLGQPSERQKLLGGVCLPVLTLADHWGRTCFVQQEKVEIISICYFLFFLILLLWLSSCCRRCCLCACLSWESTASYGQHSRNCCQSRSPALPCITSSKSGCQEHFKYILVIQLQLRVAEKKENGSWWLVILPTAQLLCLLAGDPAVSIIHACLPDTNILSITVCDKGVFT